MYGVLFTQSEDHCFIGVLLFKHKSKALLAYRALKGITNPLIATQHKEENSWVRIASVLSSSDFPETPDISPDQIANILFLVIGEKKQAVHVVNPSISDIPDIN